MADLRQILSQGRKRIGVLIGAGAPLSVRVDGTGKLDIGGAPLIPGVDALTAQAVAKLTGPMATAAAEIRASLPSGGNIETILSKVRLLQTALGTTQMHGLDGDGYAALGKTICEAIGEIVGASLPEERTPYHELVSWVSGTQRAHPVEIFTTNYDLLLETAFERAKAPYFDGFTGGHAPFFDPVTVAGNDLPPRWSRVWKLHGAIKHAFPDRTTGGKITVSFTADEGAWLLSVSDNGAGMPVGKKRGKPGLGTGIVEALSKQLARA